MNLLVPNEIKEEKEEKTKQNKTKQQQQQQQQRKYEIQSIFHTQFIYIWRTYNIIFLVHK